MEASIVLLTKGMLWNQSAIFYLTVLNTCPTKKEYIFWGIFPINVHRECNEHPIKLLKLLHMILYLCFEIKNTKCKTLAAEL
jgi:hypothetical protein